MTRNLTCFFFHCLEVSLVIKQHPLRDGSVWKNGGETPHITTCMSHMKLSKLQELNKLERCAFWEACA